VAIAQGKRIIHFLHIGKTGGTAIKAALLDHQRTRENLILFRGHDDTLSRIPAGQFAIFVVRDPVSRFVSAFNSRLRQGQPAYFRPWSVEEKVAFECFDSPNSLAVALTAEDGVLRAQSIAAMKNIYHVRDSYWKWFGNEAYFLSRASDILFIGAQERLNEHFQVFCDLLRLPKSVSLANDEVAAHRSPEMMTKYLDPVGRANLLRWYDDDYRFLNMCRQLFPHLPEYPSTVAG
jgi:hypothetical protein